MPKLVWKEQAFHGWGCDQCGFILPNPRMHDPFDNYASHLRKAFAAHACEKYPRNAAKIQSMLGS
jgi:hypothetical protein